MSTVPTATTLIWNRLAIVFALATGSQFALASTAILDALDERVRGRDHSVPSDVELRQHAPASWNPLGIMVAQALSIDERVKFLRQSVDATKDSEPRYRERIKIVDIYRLAGHFEKEISERDEIIEDQLIAPGRRAIEASHLAGVMALRSDFARSLRYVGRAKKLAGDAKVEEIELLPTDPIINALRAEATIAFRQRQLIKALEVSQKVLDQASLIAQKESASVRRQRAALNAIENQVWNHVFYLEQLGRRDEAIAFAGNSLEQAVLRNTPAASNRLIGDLQYTIARASATNGDYEAALTHIESALNSYRLAASHPHENNHALARRMRSIAHLGLGRFADMRSDLELFQSARSNNLTVASNSQSLQIEAMFALSNGQFDEAISKAKELTLDNLRWGGRDASPYKSSMALETIIQLSHPTASLQISTIKAYVDSLGSSDSQIVDGTQRGIEFEAAAVEKILERLIDFPSEAPVTFRAAELLRTDASQGSLLLGAAKMAANSLELRELIEKESAAKSVAFAGQRAFAIAATSAIQLKKGNADELVMKRQNADAETKAKSLTESDGKVSEIRREIARKFPRYQELISPKIPSAADIAKALRPDEVYVNLFPGRVAGYAFVVLASGELMAWRVPLTRQETSDAVRGYRKLFDAAQPPEDGSATGGLDLTAGRKIYKAWLAPIIEKVGVGKTIYVAASGPLAAVPWAALPASEPEGGTSKVRWAVDSGNFVTMPSASSLVLTRSLPATTASKPMLAYADPSFDGGGRTVAAVAGPIMRSVATGFIRQPNLDFDYRKLSRLPETLDEVRLIAEAVGGDSNSIVSGTAATRSKVLKDDLSQARLLVFATHGLAPGQLPGYFASGLAMAYEGAGLKDSILTVEDVANLRLNADIVLLSACNTGFATGAVGDSVSTLARSFFVAGARSLLVTAWAVESESAKQLTVSTFKAMQGATTSKAKALADTQRAMLDGKFGDRYRHPFFWAPYFLVGEAGR